MTDRTNKKLGVALLASGLSARFGQNKLLADFGGQPLVCRAMDLMLGLPAAHLAVVTACDEIASLARARGMDVVPNDAPEQGQSYSIHLAVEAMKDMDAVLLLVGDQPLLSARSLENLIAGYAQSGKGLACLRDESHQGNPAIFARRYYDALLALRGDRGAKGILRAHPKDLCVVSCVFPGELGDADTPKQLEMLRDQAEKSQK